MSRSHRAEGDLTYAPVGATVPGQLSWSAPAGFEGRVDDALVGHGDACWQRSRAALLRWGVKTASGFTVSSLDAGADTEVRAGGRYRITAQIGPLRIVEPVAVVEVVDRSDIVAFSYGTLPGHPVSGEEAFILRRESDDVVWLAIRSMTRPAPELPWRALFGPTRAAQTVIRRRYLRALR